MIRMLFLPFARSLHGYNKRASRVSTTAAPAPDCPSRACAASSRKQFQAPFIPPERSSFMLLSFGERRDAGSPERTQAMDFEASLPSQPSDEAEVAAFWNTVRRAQPISPERDLMRAVLKDALLRFRKNLHHPADRRFKAERAWFFESDGDELFSFESVCAVLGLNARRIRRNLLDWEAQAGRAA